MMGLACACASLLGIGSAALVSSSVDADVPSSGSSADAVDDDALASDGLHAPECVKSDNSTRALLRCIARWHILGDSHLSKETLAPSEKADDEAVQHLNELEEKVVSSRGTRLRNAVTQRFRDEMQHWLEHGNVLPRIYVLQGGDWGRSCEGVFHNLGYRYTLEHWMRGLIMENIVTLVKDYRAADYVYVPHCACGIFMHLAAQDVLSHERHVDMVVARRSRGKKGHQSNETRPEITYLAYEGRLPPMAVMKTDRAYLLEQAKKTWSKDPAYQNCFSRPDCRFLVVSIYGRHVFRGFSELFGKGSAVWITHAGMSNWLLKQKSDLFLGKDIADANDGTCRAACEEHCVLDPPAVLPDDIVLPWTVAYRWTARASEFASRDILVFYSGTQNSCSREQLANLFRSDFDAKMNEWTASTAVERAAAASRERVAAAEAAATASSSRGRRSARGTRRHVLIFPADFRLKQEDWSELAFRSQLCIVPDGDSPNTGRLVEVIMHGCVPLIISDRLQPPVHEYVDWSQIAFFLREANLPDLPRILREDLSGPMGTQMIRQKHANLQQVAHLFDYNRDGVSSLLFLGLRERARAFSREED